jgi:CRP-like cAMP-binding protein
MNTQRLEDGLDYLPSVRPNPEETAAPKISARLIDRIGDEPPKIGNLLSRKEQDALRSIAKLVEFPKPGMTLFTRGNDAQFVYVIDAGVVRIVRLAPNGQRRILAFMIAGDLFGIPDCGVYANTAETVSATKAYKLPWPKLRQMMAQDSQLQLNLLIKLAHDFRQAQRQMMMLGQQSAYQRLALFLLDFTRNPGFFDETHAQLTVPVNRFDLADYLGTTRETAARAFSRLEEDGLIRRINPHRIEILNMKGLQRVQYGESRRRARKES